MTKVELIAAVAENAGLSKKDAEQAVNATVEAITKGSGRGRQGVSGRLWHLRDP